MTIGQWIKHVTLSSSRMTSLGTDILICAGILRPHQMKMALRPGRILGMKKVTRKKYWMMWNENTNTFFTGWKYLHYVENILIFIKRLQMCPGHNLIIKFLSKFQKLNDFAVSVWIVGNVSSESFNKSDDVIYFGIISCTAGSASAVQPTPARLGPDIFLTLPTQWKRRGETRPGGEIFSEAESGKLGWRREGGRNNRQPGSRERQHGQYSHFTIQEGWKLPPRKQQDAGLCEMRVEGRLLNSQW